MPEESATPDLANLGRRLVDAWRARDFDAVMGFYAPDAILKPAGGGVGVFEGRQAICSFFEDWIGAYEDYEFEVEEGRDLGGGVTFAVNVERGRTPGSTGWVQLRFASLTTWADGLIVRGTNYTDIDGARAAAERLAEERAHASDRSPGSA